MFCFNVNTYKYEFSVTLLNTSVALQRCIVGSVKCSKLLTIILSAVKTRPKSYSDTSYSIDIGNHTWILNFFSCV